MDQGVNVLINTLVVIPFMVQTESIQVLKEIEKRFSISPQKNKQKRESLKGERSILQLISGNDGKQSQSQIVENIGGVVMPNMNFFSAPLLYNDFRAAIRKIWWKDPTRKLDVETTRRKLNEDRGMKSALLWPWY